MYKPQPYGHLMGKYDEAMGAMGCLIFKQTYKQI